MPWPEKHDLRLRFENTPSEVLSLAARVIYFAGHWFPTGGDLDLPGCNSGSHWKFSHYADQVLRQRFGISGDAPFQIIEGAIRLTYSSRDMWTWAEVAPATKAGMEKANALQAEKCKAVHAKLAADRDTLAYGWFEQLKSRDLGWTDEWKPIMNTEHYMREEQEIKHAKKPTGKDRSKVIQRCDEVIAEATKERDGLVWLLDHGLNIDNVIHYSHENGGSGLFCFGWREPVIDTIRDAILAVISEFPFAYRIKCADGKVLEGGID